MKFQEHFTVYLSGGFTTESAELNYLVNNTYIFILFIHCLYVFETACVDATCITFGSMLKTVILVASVQAILYREAVSTHMNIGVGSKESGLRKYQIHFVLLLCEMTFLVGM